MCEALSNIFGIDKYLSSVAEVKNGLFTGKVKRSLSGNKGMVTDLFTQYDKKGSIAVGDSENDADMLDKVEYPLVMEPNEKLQVIARSKNWKIVNRENILDIIVSYAG